jgi:hypothetical protein
MSRMILNLARVIEKVGHFYLCVSALATVAPAQMIPTGMVAGTVKDPVGGVVVNAEIALTRQLTGVTVARAKTDEGGQFLFPNILPGSYLVTVSAAGFKRWSQRVEVQAAHTATLDANLELGSLEQVVTVSAEAPLLDTVSPALATGVSARFVKDLPLQSRKCPCNGAPGPGRPFSFGPQTGNNNVYGYGGQGLGSLQFSYIASNGGNANRGNRLGRQPMRRLGWPGCSSLDPSVQGDDIVELAPAREEVER